MCAKKFHYNLARGQAGHSSLELAFIADNIAGTTLSAVL